MTTNTRRWDHKVVSEDEALELALGTPLELWLGYDGETEEDRAAREFAASDILAEQPELYDRVTSLAADVLLIHLLGLGHVTSQPRARRTNASGTAAA
jgi:hypothetical protein